MCKVPSIPPPAKGKKIKSAFFKMLCLPFCHFLMHKKHRSSLFFLLTLILLKNPLKSYSEAKLFVSRLPRHLSCTTHHFSIIIKVKSQLPAAWGCPLVNSPKLLCALSHGLFSVAEAHTHILYITYVCACVHIPKLFLLLPLRVLLHSNTVLIQNYQDLRLLGALFQHLSIFWNHTPCFFLSCLWL